MAMLATTVDSIVAIYMPDIMNVWRGIFENFPYNHIDFRCVSNKVIRSGVF